MPSPRRVLLDCDTGTDDAVAIMLAALHPALDLVGVTTVFGNHPVTECTDHTSRVLARVGRSDVPLAQGAAGPCAARPVPPDDRRLPPFPLPAGVTPAVSAFAAAEAIVAEARAGAVTVVATGPLTNLALALDLEPELPALLEELVVLGGSDSVPGVTPLAERNIWNDPVAAAAVLGAGFGRLVLVTLDATHTAPLGEGDAEALAALGTPAGEAAASMLRQRMGKHADAAGVPVHDPLAVACLLDPRVVELEPRRIEVGLAAGPAYGRTWLHAGGEPTARVALRADRGAYVDLLLRAFGA